MNTKVPPSVGEIGHAHGALKVLRREIVNLDFHDAELRRIVVIRRSDVSDAQVAVEYRDRRAIEILMLLRKQCMDEVERIEQLFRDWGIEVPKS